MNSSSSHGLRWRDPGEIDMGLDAGILGREGFEFDALGPCLPSSSTTHPSSLYNILLLFILNIYYLIIQECVKNNQVPAQQELSLKMHLYNIQIDTSREKCCQIQTIIICIFDKLEK